MVNGVRRGLSVEMPLQSRTVCGRGDHRLYWCNRHPTGPLDSPSANSKSASKKSSLRNRPLPLLSSSHDSSSSCLPDLDAASHPSISPEKSIVRQRMWPSFPSGERPSGSSIPSERRAVSHQARSAARMGGEWRSLSRWRITSYVLSEVSPCCQNAVAFASRSCSVITIPDAATSSISLLRSCAL